MEGKKISQGTQKETSQEQQVGEIDSTRHFFFSSSSSTLVYHKVGYELVPQTTWYQQGKAVERIPKWFFSSLLCSLALGEKCAAKNDAVTWNSELE